MGHQENTGGSSSGSFPILFATLSNIEQEKKGGGDERVLRARIPDCLTEGKQEDSDGQIGDGAACSPVTFAGNIGKRLLFM
jgi:hypothetical protein